MKLAEQQALEANGHTEELRAQLIELQLRENTKENIENPLSRGSSANSVCRCTLYKLTFCYLFDWINKMLLVNIVDK
jgi:hypothetical protein